MDNHTLQEVYSRQGYAEKYAFQLINKEKGEIFENPGTEMNHLFFFLRGNVILSSNFLSEQVLGKDKIFFFAFLFEMFLPDSRTFFIYST